MRRASDPVTFDRVQKHLKKNYCGTKHTKARYPFWLAGLVYCGTCGDRLCGKSAHGNGGKIPYYEHSWATKRQSCLVKKVFDCKPNRVLAKKLEPAVWTKVEELLRNPKFAQSLIAEAKAKFDNRTENDEAKRLKEKIDAMGKQLEALAERIAALPATLAPDPFYKQMEKIQELKRLEQQRLKSIQSKPAGQDGPAGLPALEALLTVLNTFVDDPIILENRIKIISRLIHRVEIRPGTFRLHFHIGKNYIDGELAFASSLFSCPKNKRAEPSFPDSALFFSSRSFKNSLGSNSLTNGWGTRIRT